MPAVWDEGAVRLSSHHGSQHRQSVAEGEERTARESRPMQLPFGDDWTDGA